MKKIIVLVLAIAGATGSALCQQTITTIDGVPATKTEQMFQDYQYNSRRIQFDFMLAKGNLMRMQLNSLSQIDSLPAMDSLLAEVNRVLSLVNDTAYDPLANKRIDYIMSSAGAQVRIKSYPPQSDVFRIRNNNEVTQLKVEQDTVRIVLYTMDQVILMNKEKKITGRQYTLTFYLNNLSDLKSIPLDKLNATIDVLKTEIQPSKAKEKKHPWVTYYAYYNIYTQKKIQNWYKPAESTKFRVSLDPYVQSGFQFMRGSAVPSAAAGIEFFQRKTENDHREWRLMWEPLFFFSRDANNKLMMDRNDFITFKQHSESKWKGPTREVEFVQNLSVGYLIRRKGNWLEKHTVKFSLPTGIQYKNILLEPEFVFNDLFQNFSPSLKLTVIFE